MYVYIDTTENFVLGLLNSKFEWLEYFENDKTKISAAIHHHINEFLDKYSCDVKDISGLIYPAGPGSYTGMRVAEGISQIFNWQNIPSFSFYHFEVPSLLGITKGKWLAKAFKGEVFEYSWSEDCSKKSLKKIDGYSVCSDGEYFSRSETMIPGDSKLKLKFTKNMIRDRSTEVFKVIVEENYKNKLYYFRELEDEFSRS